MRTKKLTSVTTLKLTKVSMICMIFSGLSTFTSISLISFDVDWLFVSVEVWLMTAGVLTSD